MPSASTATAIIEKSVEIDLGLDATDNEIILLVMKGRSSAYSVWTTMKKEAREKNLDRKVMTYRNINKRVIKLAKLGLIEEVTEPDVHAVNIHGRKDYKITVKGLECLIPHMMAYPEDVKSIIKHMDKFGVDKKVIGDLLKDRVRAIFESVNQFLRFMELPEIEAIYSRKRAAEMRLLQSSMVELGKLIVVKKYSDKPEPKSKGSSIAEAQRAAMRAARIDEGKEINKILKRVNEPKHQQQQQQEMKSSNEPEIEDIVPKASKRRKRN